jgi:hypothetical protein
MAKDQVAGETVEAGVVTAAQIIAKAQGALNKSARESLDAKVKAHFTKRLEHERAIAQIDVLVKADIDAFMAGL